MHFEPNSEEGPVIVNMHAFARSEEFGGVGKHHEIYLSDMRFRGPKKLKTMLRKPVG